MKRIKLEASVKPFLGTQSPVPSWATPLRPLEIINQVPIKSGSVFPFRVDVHVL